MDAVVSTYTLGCIPYATRTMAIKEISRYAPLTPHSSPSQCHVVNTLSTAELSFGVCGLGGAGC